MSRNSFIEKIIFPPTLFNKQKLHSKIRGKTILITGASSGIGEQVAYLLADIDIHMILVARNKGKLLTMKQEIEVQGAQVSVYSADLRNPEEIGGLLDMLHQLPHGIDILVSNAGKSIRRAITQSYDRFHDFSRTMAINYFAPVQLLLSTIPLLKKTKGQIINVSTVNALLLPVPYWAAYQASKSAFDVWFRSAAPELNAMGIATTSIYFPLVRTPMIAPTKAYRDMPAMNARHAAQIICKAMYTRKHKYKPWWLIFGQLASVIFRGVWDRIAPRLIRLFKSLH